MRKRASSPTRTIRRRASPTPRPNMFEYLVGECDSTSSKAPMVAASILLRVQMIRLVGGKE